MSRRVEVFSKKYHPPSPQPGHVWIKSILTPLVTALRQFTSALGVAMKLGGRTKS